MSGIVLLLLAARASLMLSFDSEIDDKFCCFVVLHYNESSMTTHCGVTVGLGIGLLSRFAAK